MGQPFIIGPVVIDFGKFDDAPDIFCPLKCKVTRIRTQVVDALTAGDDGFIVAYDNLDNEMTNGTTVVPAGSVRNFKASPPAPTAFNVVAINSWFRLRYNKGATPGGVCRVWIEAVPVP